MKSTLLFSLTLFLAGSTQAQDVREQVQAASKRIDARIAKGPFHANWDSLKAYKVPEWYQDAKFGIFIHWGVYSVPAFDNEWYPRNMYIPAEKAFQHHVATFGPQSKFGYKDFIPRFTADKFDPNAWAELFRKAGAKYVIPVAEHHDGFAMYNSDYSDWTAAKMGPKRDVVGELATAIRSHGMHFGASSHRAEHWWFFGEGMKFDSDVRDPKYLSFYGPAQPQKIAGQKGDNPPSAEHMDNWLARSTEIVDKYRPEVMWFDWWIEQPAFQPYLQRFAAYYYDRAAERKQGVAINYKNTAFPEQAAVLDIERGKLDAARPYYWQTDTSISIKSWGYIDNDTFRTPESLINELVDIVSKNGCLLLNVGPRSDGTIPEQAQKILLSMGEWLAVNGEAIYGTRPWKISGEGPTKVVGGSFKDTEGTDSTSADFRFTRKGADLYAISMAWPADGNLLIKSLGQSAGKITRVTLLGAKDPVGWKQNAEGLSVQVPVAHRGNFGCALKISGTIAR